MIGLTTDPVDRGTKEVVAGGLRCVDDPAMRY